MSSTTLVLLAAAAGAVLLLSNKKKDKREDFFVQHPIAVLDKIQSDTPDSMSAFDREKAHQIITGQLKDFDGKLAGGQFY